MGPMVSRTCCLGIISAFILTLSELTFAQLPAPAPAKPPSISAPTGPTISGTLLVGANVVSGSAQKAGAAGYTNVEIFVCVSSQTATTLAACDGSQAGVTSATLTNSQPVPAGGGDFVLPDANGNYAALLASPLERQKCVYITEVATPAGGGKALTSVSGSSVCTAEAFRKSAPLIGVFGGLDVTGASSAGPQAVFLGTGIIDAPLSTKPSEGHFFDSRIWLTGQLRVAGMAQPKDLTGALGTTASAATYLATAVNANPDGIVQSLEGTGSVSIRLMQPWDLPVSSLDVGNFQDAQLANPSTIISLSAVLSMGAITPLSVSQANPPVYNLTSQIIQQYPNITFPTTCSASSPCYVAFVPTDRAHFYRYYSGGIRAKIYAGDYKDNEYRFPGMVDLSVGQNEYVTGGQMRHLVLHIGGVFPVPTADGVYIFGSMDSALTKNGKEGSQLILTPATSTSTAPLSFASNSVTDIPVSQPNRDRYQIGFGIDIFHLISSFTTKSSTTGAASH